MDPAPDDPIRGSEPASRRSLLPLDADDFLKTTLAERFPATASLGLQLRDLVRTQLLTAVEEFSVRSGDLFVGYSVHSYAQDPIVGLKISPDDVTLIFAQGTPVAGKNTLIAGKNTLSGSVSITSATMDDPMILKILLREAARTSRPRLPPGRNGHTFVVGARSEP